MSKKILVITVLVIVAGALVVGAINRTQAKSSEAREYRREGRNASLEISTGDGSVDQIVQSNSLVSRGGSANYLNQKVTSELAIETSDLTADEIDALLYMREEEKLARDVYLFLADTWSLDVFENISISEQVHMDAVERLLDRYGLVDSVSEEQGIFSDPNLQALYDELVAHGSESLSEALKVAASIEEIDILDLQERISLTDKVDIQRVFNNLIRGSSNHLRAFVGELLSQTGEEYQPQYLAVDEYESILAGVNQAGVAEANGIGGGGNRRGMP